MSVEQSLFQRANNSCELCGNSTNLRVYAVPESPVAGVDSHILICDTCEQQVEDETMRDANHWRCLNDSMWSTVSAVKVMAWRMLQRLRQEGWPQDLLGMMYMEEDELS